MRRSYSSLPLDPFAGRRLPQAGDHLSPLRDLRSSAISAMTLFSVSSTSSASTPPLACTVRDCALPIERRERVYICGRGHSYDIARSGYVNLLQPQDRRSLHAGDSTEAVAARAALLDAGVGRTLIDAVVDKSLSLDLPERPVITDLGSGTGDALAAIGERRAITGVGIDISTAAADHAARRFPNYTWVVANADRRLPLLDGSVDLVLSLNGRRNPEQTARILKPEGILLIVLPAPDDLIELRTLVQGEGVQRERGDALVAAHRQWFEVIHRSPFKETITLERESLLHLLRTTYRGARLTSAARVAAIDRTSVTLASEVFVLSLIPNP